MSRTTTSSASVMAGGVAFGNELRRALAPNYILLEHLAFGGMGAVYLARDPALKRSVAVKVLSAELATSEEARAAPDPDPLRSRG